MACAGGRHCGWKPLGRHLEFAETVSSRPRSSRSGGPFSAAPVVRLSNEALDWLLLRGPDDDLRDRSRSARSCR